MFTLWLVGVIIWLIMAVTWGGLRYAKGDFSDYQKGESRAVQHVFVVCIVGGALWPLGICATIGIYLYKKNED